MEWTKRLKLRLEKLRDVYSYNGGAKRTTRKWILLALWGDFGSPHKVSPYALYYIRMTPAIAITAELNIVTNNRALSVVTGNRYSKIAATTAHKLVIVNGASIPQINHLLLRPVSCILRVNTAKLGHNIAKVYTPLNNPAPTD